MARRINKKIQEVKKFGGTEKIADVKFDKDPYDVSNIEAQSKTKLDMDGGEGVPVVIRQFQFGLNPVAWKQNPPSRQDLFNYHLKGIEVSLWRDGLKPYTNVEPRLVIDAEKMQYTIFIAAIVARGHILNQNPRTLKQIVNQ